tara:strand:- start:17 stop:631 length:615 start_codon:yes stop_codon:yes gene_type:complete
MTIIVTFKTFEYEPIIEYYNQNKPPDWNPIEKLNRIEGGFQIKLKGFNHDRSLVDINQRIKQVRWCRQQLTTPIAMFGFTMEEEYLLYQSFLHVYGKDEVKQLPHRMESTSSLVTKFNYGIKKDIKIGNIIVCARKDPVSMDNNDHIDSDYTYEEESYSDGSYDQSQDREFNSSDDTVERNVHRLSIIDPSKIESHQIEPECWI